MRSRTLLLRSLTHYARANAAVVLGVATAVTVLAGALLVGESVRASLRRTVLERLGNTDTVVASTGFFRQELAAELAPAAPALIALPGIVTEQTSGRRAGDVRVYGVDDRFWTFHGRPSPGLADRDAAVSEALARELGGTAGGTTLLLRVEAPAGVPGSSLFGRRDDPLRTVRLRLETVLTPEGLGEFSLQPQQQEVRALFLPLGLLQRSIGQEGNANTVLLAAGSGGEAALRKAARLPDLGLRVRALPGQGTVAVESTSGLLGDDVAAAVRQVAAREGLHVTESLIYLANAIRLGERAIPYSLVAGLDPAAYRSLGGGADPDLVLDTWAAEDLGAKRGDPVRLDYYLWKEEGRLETRTTELRVGAVVPLVGLAADRDLVPDYPGITQSAHLSDWDPPFPVDLARIRPKDERYWERYHATPKAFLPLAEAQKLWGHRLGRLTSIRLRPRGGDLETARASLEVALLALLDPARAGLRLDAVRARAQEAAEGTTDFGQYFVYFSFFLLMAALLLAGLFFRLGIEQRLRELGLLRALGFHEGRLRRQYLTEGVVLAVLGGVLGIAGALLYAQLLVLGLRTLWVEAVGTRALDLHLAPGPLILGALGGVGAALVTIALTLRGFRGRSPRRLLSGAGDEWAPTRRPLRWGIAFVLAGGAALLLAASATGRLDATGGFFGGGALLLAGFLFAARAWLGGRRGAGQVKSLTGLGLRSASYRPGRSVVCIALIAFAAFVIVSVGAFRHGGTLDVGARDSESGGYRLYGRSLRPLHHDPLTAEGRAALDLPEDALGRTGVARFRMRAGQDASCLNLYRPDNPTVLAPSAAFRDEGRFAFQSSLAESPEDKANPWRLLDRDAPDGALPVVADAGSLAYVLHKAVGETMTLGDSGTKVRFVAALRPGLFQGELLMGERHFLKAFPEEDGYRFFLFDVPAARAGAVTEALEKALADYGLDVGDTGARLAAYHQVENTYISTFQALGSLGLLLGTAGLATVLLRNAFEQRRELALLRAVGYRGSDLGRLVIAENLFLLLLGLLAGSVSALVAVSPALREREGQLPLLSLAALLVAVIATGLVVSRLAVLAIQRLPVLGSLRSE